ncbi:hypothetical protein BD626DRAFT_579040 [Schizophyllum amplum]|uniref:Uncharacterized protein n=1 Tax=Schizophyllum amplum TaxID=97359 RepID=A0A550BRQ2_9AGAR|nr:hypothetical protein BD626DRAFT_579040 [Auriculariopsis ampla]
MIPKLPPCYDNDVAAQRLDWVISARKASAGEQVAGALKLSSLSSRFSVVDGRNAYAKVLVGLADPSVESVLEITGVVVDQEMPPFYEKPRCNNGRARFLKQVLVICGLKDVGFDDSMFVIERIRQFFERSVDGSVAPCEQSFDQLGTTITLAQRMFSHRKDVDESAIVPFEKDVDPRGHLARLATGHLVHTTDNQVKYWKYVSDEGCPYR